jgi:hypothetical protein
LNIKELEAWLRAGRGDPDIFPPPLDFWKKFKARKRILIPKIKVIKKFLIHPKY